MQGGSLGCEHGGEDRTENRSGDRRIIPPPDVHLADFSHRFRVRCLNQNCRFRHLPQPRLDGHFHPRRVRTPAEDRHSSRGTSARPARATACPPSRTNCTICNTSKWRSVRMPCKPWACKAQRASVYGGGGPCCPARNEHPCLASSVDSLESGFRCRFPTEVSQVVHRLSGVMRGQPVRSRPRAGRRAGGHWQGRSVCA